jgi:hypothetical protein
VVTKTNTSRGKKEIRRAASFKEGKKPVKKNLLSSESEVNMVERREGTVGSIIECF